jgi:hypothetical protein
MDRNEAIEIVKKNWPDGRYQLSEALQTLIPELKESEDERIRKALIQYIKYNVSVILGWRKEELIAWLKKQGSQNLANSAKTCKVEQNPAWSEEDEIGFRDAMWAIEQARTIAKNENDMGNLWYAEKWLKSLKERYTWKPSDEQMKLLREVQQALLGKDCHNRFVNFMCDLKKLKG